MANHLRRQIRDAMVTALTGLATTGANVFGSRVYPLQDANLPALRVSTPAEEINILSMGYDRLMERTLTVTVDACVKAVSGYENSVDQIVKEVEVVLGAGANLTLGALCKHVTLRSINTELAGDAEKPIAVATMNFEVLYVAALSAPDVAR